MTSMTTTQNNYTARWKIGDECFRFVHLIAPSDDFSLAINTIY